MQIQALLTASTINLKRLLRQRPVPQAGLGVGLTGQPTESEFVSAHSGSVERAQATARRIQGLIGFLIAFDRPVALLPAL